MYGTMSLAPSAQFRPIAMGLEWLMEFQNASFVWPDRVRPELSTMVPDTNTGIFWPHFSKYMSMANIAAFALRVSKMVSTSSTSTPPSIRASTCS